MLPDEQSHDSGMDKFGRFWVKKPRRSETKTAETCYLCRSTRPAVSFRRVLQKMELTLTKYV